VVEIWRMEEGSKASPGKKVFETLISMEKRWVWWCKPVIRATGGSIKEEYHHSL
jgi:hypothetical protein